MATSQVLELGGTFPKRIKWSPDSELLLANLEDGTMQIFNRQLCKVSSVIGHFGGFNDFEWYPWMNWPTNTSCCFVTVSKNLPVQLWNVKENNGLHSTIRSTWTAKDHLDQISTCYSVSISPEGKYIVAGGHSSMWCFDITRSGCESLIPRQIITSRKCKDGQTGIISNISFRNDSSNVFAASSLDGSIAIYDLRSLQCDFTVKATSCSIFKAHDFGSSQSKFLSDGWSLISVGRKENAFKIWDLRKLSNDIFMPLSTYTLPYTSPSNQRIYFDASIDDTIVIGSGRNLMRFRNDNGEGEVLCGCESIVSSVSVNSFNQFAFSEGSRPCRFADECDPELETDFEKNLLNTSVFRIKIDTF